MGNFLHIVLEAAQRFDNALVNNDAVTDNTNLGAVGNLAFNYIAAGNLQLGNSNQLTDFYAALDNLFEFRSKHTLDSSLNVVECVVDNAVGAYVNLLGFGSLTRVSVRTNVKADNQCVSSGCQHYVGLGDSAYACMDNGNLNLIVFDFFQGCLQCFDGALNVSLNNDVQLFDFAFFNALEQVIQRNLGVQLDFLFLLLGDTFFSNAAGSLFIGAVQDIAGSRYIIQAQYLYRGRRQSFFNLFATIIDHCTNLTIGGAGNNGITDMQSTALYQYGSNRAAALIQLCLDDGAVSRQVRVSLQLLHFSNQQNHFQQVADTGFLMCGNRNHNGVAAPILRNKLMLSQLLFNVIRICARTVDFIDSYNDRYLGSLSMVDSLDGLRHYTVICCYNQNCNVGYLCAAGTHSSESLMARGIQEDNLLALVVNLVSTDMLGNTAGLAGGNVGFTDSVQQGGFTMVNVAHNGNNRRTRNAFFRRIVNLGNFGRILFWGLLANLYAEVVADKLCGIEIDILVDGNHYSQHKQSLDYFINLTLNELGKFLYVNRFADFNVGRTNDFYRSLLLLRCGLLAAAVYRHLMAGAAVRTAFAGSVAALNLRLVVLTALACVATALTVIASAFAATAIAAFAAATANLCTAFAVYALAGLLALGAYKDTALALLAITATLTVALLAATILRTTFITATLIVTLAALAVALLAVAILRTAFVAATLTILITPLSVVVALIILLILLHIPLSVIPIHIVIVSFSCSLRMRRSSRFADITFFRLRRFRRFWFFIISFTDNRHSLVISCTKISFFDIIFLQ